MGWGEQAVLQLKGEAAVWAMHRVPMSMPIEWSTFCTELQVKYILSHTLDLGKCEWEELRLKKRECVTEFNEHFGHLHSRLDLHQPKPAEILPHAYGYKIKKGNQGVYNNLVHYIGIRDRTPTLEQHIEHLATLDTSLIKTQPGNGSNTNTNTTMQT